MKDRLKALKTLARIQSIALDSASSELTKAQEKRAHIEDALQDIDTKRHEASSVDIVEALPYMHLFFDGLKKEAALLREAAHKADQEIAAKKEVVFNAWNETKTTEHLQDKTVRDILQEQSQRDQQEMDERNVIKYARSAKPSV